MRSSVRVRNAGFETPEVRLDGPEKVSGAAAYAADASRPGMLWAAFVSSPVPHARIISIDTEPARAMPGVRAVLTGADIGEHYQGRGLLDWPVLARDVVLFAGEYVVAVAAETRASAEAAALAIEVRYEELPAVFEPASALAAGAPVLHPHPERYPFIAPGGRRAVAHPNVQGALSAEHGDVEAALRGAARVFEHRFSTPRYAGGSLEPRATLVWIDAGGIVHVISTNKSPFNLRRQLAAATGLPPEAFVIESTHIGGDFGAKGLSIDEFACYFLARATGRPVKAVRSYLDDLRSTNTRHASDVLLKTGIAADGTIVAMSARVVFNGGAFAAGKPIPTLLSAGAAFPSLPYRIPNGRFELTSVYTNTIPAGHVRAPGAIQMIFAIESHLDAIARELGDDPLAFRLRNAGRAGERGIDGHEFSAPQTVEVLEALRRASGWETAPAPGRGRGIALSMRHIGGGATSVKLLAHADGTIDVESGHADQGAGTITALARIVHVRLGIPLDRVRITLLPTNAAGEDPGAGGSRVVHVNGNAVIDAVDQLHAALRDDGWDGDAATYADGVARLAGRAGSLAFTGTYDSKTNPASHIHTSAAVMADVSVDRETGVVTLEDVLFVGDVGTIVNPVAHRGQIDGGFVFGLGHALTEELIVEDGHIRTLSLADYKLPSMPDIPPFRVELLTGAPGPGPFGAKAVGELVTELVAPAIANAVADACGARIDALPITAERVLARLGVSMDTIK